MRTIIKFSHTVVFICTLHLTILSHWTAPTAAGAMLKEELRSTITTLVKARNSIVLRHHKSAAENAQQSTEQQDLLVFVSYLDGRIYYYCQQLFDSGGIKALTETGCPTTQNGELETTRHSTIPSTSSQTSDEKLTALDSSFGESLGTFDEMLLEEQQKVASHAPRQRENGSGADTDLYDAVNNPSSQGRNGASGTDSGYSGTSDSSADNNGSRNTSSTPGTGSNQGTGCRQYQTVTDPANGRK